MHKKHHLLLLAVLLSYSLFSQLSYCPEILITPANFPTQLVSDQPLTPEPGPTPRVIVRNSPIKGVAIDSAISFRMVSPEDSVPMTMQVFDQFTSEGKPLRSTYYSWNEKGKYWENLAKEDLYYTITGDLKERQYYSWNQEYEVYSMSEFEKFNYKGGHLCKYEFEAYDAEVMGRKVREHVEQYDKEGRLVLLRTKVRLDELGWTEESVLDIKYDGDKVSVNSKVLKNASASPEFDEDELVLDPSGETFQSFLLALRADVYPARENASTYDHEQKMYYFYSSSDLLAEQTGP